MAFTRRGTFTVQGSQVPSTQTNFPVLVTVTHNDLRSIANGGYVADANGYDIRWFSNNTLTTGMSFTRKSWNATTGQCSAWVKVPSLADGSIVYAGFGDAALNTDASDAANTFDSSFKRVVRFANVAGALTGYDVINAASGTVNGNTAVATGVHGVAASFDGSGDNVAWASGIAASTVDDILVTILGQHNGTTRMDWVSQGWDASGKLTFTMLQELTTKKMEFFWEDGNPPTTLASTNKSTTALTANTWYIIHGRYVSASHLGSIFINGTQENTKDSFGTHVTPYTGGKFQVGENEGGGGDMNGLVDVVYVQESSRTTNWITTEKNSILAPGTFWGSSFDAAPSSAVPVFMNQYRQRWT